MKQICQSQNFSSYKSAVARNLSPNPSPSLFSCLLDFKGLISMATSSIRFTPLHSFSSPLLSKAIISPKLKFVNLIQIGNPFKFQLKKGFKVKGSSFIVRAAIGKLSELDPVPLGPESGFPNGSGVYGIYDKNGELQFIGISRNIGASIESHSKLGPDLCYSVKVGLIDEPSPDRTVLTSAWKSWMEEHIAETGKVPPGNAKGNTTWARPPPQKKPNLHLTPGRHVKLTVPLEDLIDRLVKEKEVVAFIKGTRSASLCGFSQKVVGILESTGVDFECVDVLDEEYNYGLRETLKRYSNWPTFPQVFVKGELLGGCDIISDMAEKGELATIFKKQV